MSNKITNRNIAGNNTNNHNIPTWLPHTGPLIVLLAGDNYTKYNKWSQTKSHTVSSVFVA